MGANAAWAVHLQRTGRSGDKQEAMSNTCRTHCHRVLIRGESTDGVEGATVAGLRHPDASAGLVNCFLIWRKQPEAFNQIDNVT